MASMTTTTEVNPIFKRGKEKGQNESNRIQSIYLATWENKLQITGLSETQGFLSEKLCIQKQTEAFR